MKTWVAIVMGLLFIVTASVLIISFAAQQDQEFQQICTGDVHIPSACMEWAFGENWKKSLKSEVADLWNERHADLFIVHGTDDYVLSMAKIYRTWREQE